jgi:glycosyltransferase involved in cell wall biosynthesis
MHRKNPGAALKAFLKAFPLKDFGPDEVGLVLKVHPPKTPHPDWEALKSLAKHDGRVHIIEETLSRAALLDLYQACDCFVSLHRAEGFGRGMAEALQLGLRLIVTDYSGNVDFCRTPEFSERIKNISFRLDKVRPGQYPYGSNQVWASADIRAAAKAMQVVAREIQESQGQLLPVPKGGWPVFSPQKVGQRYVERLLEIF